MDIEIRDQINAAIQKLQELNGKPIPEIDDETRPVGDIPGFDSLIAAELVVMLSVTLEVELEPRIMLSNDGTPATIREITNNVLESLAEARG